MEIKLASEPDTDDLARLNKAADLIRADRRVLVSRTRTPAVGAREISCDRPTLLKLLR